MTITTISIATCTITPWITRLRNSPARLHSMRHAFANCAGTARSLNLTSDSPKRAVAGSLPGRDAYVMAAQVLRVEVLVEHGAEDRAPEDLHVPPLAMDQLVRHDDR